MGKKSYNTYGNVAYATQRAETAQPKPEKKQPKPEKSPRSRPANFTRKHIALREKGEISPFGVAGFFASCLMAALLMSSYAHLTSTADQVVQLRSQLIGLESQQVTLSAQYEKLFDLQRIEEAVGVEMIRPTSDQVVYIDLAHPDNVTIYDQEKNGLGFFRTLGNIISDMFA